MKRVGLSLLGALVGLTLVMPTASGAPNPDARRILYVRSGDIYSVQTNGLNPRRLTATRNNSQPEWAPASNKIVFVSSRDGDQEIFTMNPDGSGAKQLTRNKKTDTGPTWSPDGSTIAFERDFEFDRYQGGVPDSIGWALWLMTSGGSNQRQVPLSGPVLGGFFELIHNLVWSPDGQYIAGTGMEWSQTQDDAVWAFHISGEYVTGDLQGGVGVSFATDGEIVGCGHSGMWKWDLDEFYEFGTHFLTTTGEEHFFCTYPSMSGGLKFATYVSDEHSIRKLFLHGIDVESGSNMLLAEVTGTDPYDWSPSGRLMVAATPAGIRVVAPDLTYSKLLPVMGTDPNW